MILRTLCRGVTPRVLCLRALSFCAAGLFVAAMSPRASAAPDLSTPKKAALAFAKAVEAGDMAAAKEASTGNEEDYKLVQHMADMIGSMKKFQAAVTKKFGADKLPVDMSTIVSKQFESADEKIDGDNATLVLKEKPDDKHPPKLKKSGGVWKLDLSTLKEDPEFMKVKEMAPKVVKAVDAVTKDIDSGKYKTHEEAFGALGEAMEKAGT